MLCVIDVVIGVVFVVIDDDDGILMVVFVMFVGDDGVFVVELCVMCVNVVDGRFVFFECCVVVCVWMMDGVMMMM